MYNQPLMRPIAPPQKKMKAWPLIFTLSLIALIFASIWLLFELPQELDYLFDSFGELDMFRNFFSIVADLLFFTAVLLFFLFAVTLYKKRSAKTIFSLVQLFWMIGAAMVVLWYLFFIVDMSDYMFGYHDYDYYNYYPAGYEHYYFFSIADVLETFSFWIAILVLSILSACKSFKKGSGIGVLVAASSLSILNSSSSIFSNLEWYLRGMRFSDLISFNLLFNLFMILFHVGLILYLAFHEGVPGSKENPTA